MSAVRTLFGDILRRDKVRLGCAILGVGAAVALLTWTLGLAVTTWYQGRPMSEAMGRPYDCWVATGRASAAAPKGSGIQSLTPGSPIKRIPAAVIDAVETFEGVQSCVATTVDRCRIDWRPDGRPVQGPGYVAGFASTEAFAECPYPDGLATGRWPSAEGGASECVLSPFVFGEQGLKDAPPLGTRLALVTIAGRVEATVVGYLSESIRPVSGFPSLFANIPQAAEGKNLLLLKLTSMKRAAALGELIRSVSPDDDAAKLVTRDDLLKQLRQDAIESLARQVPLLVMLACVATLCMIVNALCIGIEQHRLRYARLRALGMTRGQLARLITMEGVFIAGVGGILGGIVGTLVLAGMIASQPLLFPDGMHLTWGTPCAVVAFLLLSTICALFLPLRQVRRLKPFELKGSGVTTQPLRHGVLRFVVGLLLMTPILFTLVRFTPQPMLRSLWLLLVGLPTLIIGLMLVVKPLLAAVEGGLRVSVARLLGLHPTLLKGCLTRLAARHARMCLMLMTGLGAYIAIHIWGASLTGPFIPSRQLPAAIISILPNGVSEPVAKQIGGTPFYAAQYPLAEADLAQIITRTGAKPAQNNLLLIGTEGEAGVTVTEMFARQCHVQPGDTLHLQRKEADGRVLTLPLTITAVRKVNWHLVTARANLRARNGAPFGTLGPIFVSAQVAKTWDPKACARVQFLWVNDLQAADDAALYSASEMLEKRAQALADKDPYMPPRPAGMGRGRGPGPGPMAQTSNVVVHLRDEINRGTLTHSAELVGALARIPLWSLLVLCLGFVSLLTANVRTRTSELRTLHAMGMTRRQMMRMLFAEVLLLVFAAIVLSLLFGFCIGWSFTGWTLAWMPFGGLPVQLILPWAELGHGVLVLLIAIFLITPLPIVLLVRKLLK